jgi:hypothetical protein
VDERPVKHLTLPFAEQSSAKGAGQRNIFSQLPLTKSDYVSAEKAIRVIRKQRGLRLSRAAESVEAVFRGDVRLLRLPGGAPASGCSPTTRSNISRQIRRTHSCRCVPRWPLRLEPRPGPAASHRGRHLVKQEIAQYRTAEGPADEVPSPLKPVLRTAKPYAKVRKRLDTAIF